MQKRHWLIGSVTGVLLSAGAYYYLDNLSGDSLVVSLLGLLFIPASFTIIANFGFDSHGITPFAIFVLYGFLVGAILGWLYGKIKKSFSLNAKR